MVFVTLLLAASPAILALKAGAAQPYGHDTRLKITPEIIADAPANTYITAEQIDDFHRDGVVGPFNTNIDPTMIAEYAAHLKNMTEADPYAQWHSHLTYPQPLADLLRPSVIYNLKKLLGEILLIWRTTIFNIVNGKAGTRYHQEWGAFGGEEVGENDPSIIPAGHNYEDMEEEMAGLLTSVDNGEYFMNLTTMGPPPDVVHDHLPMFDISIWFGLTDIPDETHSAMKFFPGSQKTQYPPRAVSIKETQEWSRIEAQFWTAFKEVETEDQFWELLRTDKLLPGFDSALFENSTLAAKEVLLHTDSADNDSLLHKLKKFIVHEAGHKHIARLAMGIPADGNPYVRTYAPMKPGQYLIFLERVLHATTPNAAGNADRVSYTIRATKGDTWIYPQLQREENQNLPEGAPIYDMYKKDIRPHYSILLGEDSSTVDPRNRFVTIHEFAEHARSTTECAKNDY